MIIRTPENDEVKQSLSGSCLIADYKKITHETLLFMRQKGKLWKKAENE